MMNVKRVLLMLCLSMLGIFGLAGCGPVRRNYSVASIENNRYANEKKQDLDLLPPVRIDENLPKSTDAQTQPIYAMVLNTAFANINQENIEEAFKINGYDMSDYENNGKLITFRLTQNNEEMDPINVQIFTNAFDDQTILVIVDLKGRMQPINTAMFQFIDKI